MDRTNIFICQCMSISHPSFKHGRVCVSSFVNVLEHIVMPMLLYIDAESLIQSNTCIPFKFGNCIYIL